MGFWRSKPPAGVILNRGHPLSRALAFYAALSEGSGAACDLVGGLVGSNSGVLWAGGPNGTVIQGVADSSLDFGNAGSLDFGIGAFAISAWVNTTAAARQTICHKYSNPAGGVGFMFEMASSGLLQFVTEHAADYTVLDSAGVINDGRWHHVVGSWTGTVMSMWVDGRAESTVPVQTGNAPPYDLSSSVSFQIVGAAGGFAASFVGKVSSVAVFKRALQASDVSTLYNDQFCLLATPSWRRVVGGYGLGGAFKPTRRLSLGRLAIGL